MAINTSIEEHRLLVTAEDEIAQYGKTQLKCSRCGNDIVLEDFGSSYTIRCKSPDCIRADFKGI